MDGEGWVRTMDGHWTSSDIEQEILRECDICKLCNMLCMYAMYVCLSVCMYVCVCVSGMYVWCYGLSLSEIHWRAFGEIGKTPGAEHSVF